MSGNSHLLGGLYGALVGDAVGCPYEFTRADEIPPYEAIEMIPPKDFDRAWADIEVGTYTDDGAQALVLLHTINTCVPGDFVPQLHANLVRWKEEGFMSVDGFTFDVGNQTMLALTGSVQEVTEVLSGDHFAGNGSLMRCIAVPLTAPTLVEAVRMGAYQSRATHPSKLCQVTCAMYSAICWQLLHCTDDIGEALIVGMLTIRSLMPEYSEALDKLMAGRRDEPTGSGYVVNSFWSAMHAMWTGNGYEDVIKKAIQLGNDTDTTACIAGGMAGIMYGHHSIPEKWLTMLRGRATIDPLATSLTGG